MGIALKRIEVIADDEEEIVEAARRMSNNYDFVVTSGGIGPTVRRNSSKLDELELWPFFCHSPLSDWVRSLIAR